MPVECPKYVTVKVGKFKVKKSCVGINFINLCNEKKKIGTYYITYNNNT